MFSFVYNHLKNNDCVFITLYEPFISAYYEESSDSVPLQSGLPTDKQNTAGFTALKVSLFRLHHHNAMKRHKHEKLVTFN